MGPEASPGRANPAPRWATSSPDHYGTDRSPGQAAPVRRLLRKLAASAGIAAAAAGLMVFATAGSFDGTDPFPHSVQLPSEAYR